MKDYRKHVEAAIRATVVHSPTTFSWFGKKSYQIPSGIRRALTPGTARSYLLFNLQSQLYSDFYCQGLAVPARLQAAIFPPGGTPFVEALSEANSGRGYWDERWEVRAIGDNYVVIRKGGVELWTHPERCLLPNTGSITPGTYIKLRFPKEFLRLSPGFYMALSDEQVIENDTQPLVRFYWDLAAEVAVKFVRITTLLLNRAHLPFRLKVPNDPVHYTRCDAGVIYIRRSDYEAAVVIFERVYSEVIGGLRQATPVFTKQLAPGVGVAEDPGFSESFGQHRCGLLADGMIRAYEQGAQSLAERLRIVEERFAEEGISLESPFLNPGSNDIYVFHHPLERRIYRPLDDLPASYIVPDRSAFLKTADLIGQRLAQEAVWYQDRCNWLGADLDARAPSDGQPRRTYRALGPEVYNGTSGVALFLAELHAATGDAAVRRTALGAIRQALSRVDSVAARDRLGFYTGWIGMAVATARVGIILGEEALLESARQLLQRTIDATAGWHEVDILSGAAGALAGLVALRDILGDASLLEFAARLGDELLQAANQSDAGYSWGALDFPKQRNLTGFSHGAAGVGYALLELFQVTDDSRYLEAARLAFQYERFWFDAEAGNWPDFRGESAWSKRSKRPLAFATYWCHGAPGIALARLRAYEALKDETYKAEAIVALQTTRKALEQSMHSETGNFSLCHGLAGNAEVLHYGGQVLGQESFDGFTLASEVAQMGIARYAREQGSTWPCGTANGETPGLMLGLSGIGYFYLRMHNPAIPSILILQREQFSVAETDAMT